MAQAVVGDVTDHGQDQRELTAPPGTGEEPVQLGGPGLWKMLGSMATAQSLVSIPSQRGSTPCSRQASPAGTRCSRPLTWPCRAASD